MDDFKEKLKVALSEDNNPKQQNNIVPYIIIVLLFLTVVILVCDKLGILDKYIYKFNLMEQQKQEQQFQFPEPKIILKQQPENKDEKYQILYDRVRLLGMINNENFSVLKYEGQNGNFIFFDENWKINRMPKYLKLNENEREFLEKYKN